MGVEHALYEAGGYENLPKQLSQFDDCMARQRERHRVGPISEAGLGKKFAKGVRRQGDHLGASIRSPGAFRDREDDRRFRNRWATDR